MKKLRQEYIEALRLLLLFNSPADIDEIDRQSILHSIIQNLEWAANGSNVSECGKVLLPDREKVPYHFYYVFFLEFSLGSKRMSIVADPVGDFSTTAGSLS